jgi:hypothetical protein
LSTVLAEVQWYAEIEARIGKLTAQLIAPAISRKWTFFCASIKQTFNIFVSLRPLGHSSLHFEMPE